MSENKELLIVFFIIILWALIFVLSKSKVATPNISNIIKLYESDPNKYNSQSEYIITLKDKKIVRTYNIDIDEEMDIISKFIKSNNNRIPILVADSISYSIVTRCDKHKLPHELILGIIAVESFYDPCALGPPVGRKNRRARGLGQVLDETCENEEIDKDKLHNIDYNIEYTIKILLSKLKISNGDIDKALYLYVGKSDEYSSKVFRIMGEFRYFRAQKI